MDSLILFIHSASPRKLTNIEGEVLHFDTNIVRVCMCRAHIFLTNTIDRTQELTNQRKVMRFSSTFSGMLDVEVRDVAAT